FARVIAALFVGAMAAGCTAGEVTYNGQSVRQHPGLEYLVEFYNPEDWRDNYITDVTWGTPHYPNLATFSFDPSAQDVEPGANAVTMANRKVTIPEGTYRAKFSVIDRTTPSQAYFVSAPFSHSYPSTSSVDNYNGSSIPTTLYEIQVLPPNDNCPAAVDH